MAHIKALPDDRPGRALENTTRERLRQSGLLRLRATRRARNTAAAVAWVIVPIEEEYSKG